jgi:hypothetical protein
VGGRMRVGRRGRVGEGMLCLRSGELAMKWNRL